MDNFKPFNLKKMLDGEPGVMRNGTEIIDFKYFEGSNTLFVEIFGSAGSILIQYKYCQSGKFQNEETDHPYDLFMQPQKKNFYIAIKYIPTSDGYYQTSNAYPTMDLLHKYIEFICDPKEWSIHEIEMEV